MAIWRMRIACWIPKAIDTHSEYVILIAFPMQWLHEHCLSCFPLTYQNAYQFARTQQKSQLTVRSVHRSHQSCWPSVWNCCISPLWCLEFWCGP